MIDLYRRNSLQCGGMKHTSRTEKAAWIRHYETSHNIAATCRHFGIARSTLYRWIDRFDPAHPRASLARRHPARVTRPAPKTALYFQRVLDLSVAHPHWGARRIMRALLVERSDAPSEGTIGRWLAYVRGGCPICGRKDGSHNIPVHLFRNDIVQWELFKPIRPPRTRRRAKSKEGIAAVWEVERLLRGHGER
jgi:transposase-like protein